MSQQASPPLPPICTVDACKQLMITRNSDGSITRGFDFPATAASADPNGPSRVLTKDLPLNPSKGTWVRLYLPKAAALAAPVYNSSSQLLRPPPPREQDKKLPIILYFHGGGFIIIHADSTMTHDFCSGVSEHTGAVLVSIEYRLAPEHRLPAAYDDATEALFWLRDQGRQTATSQKEDWLTRYGDFSRCFIMGDSAGGNMTYHVGLRASNQAHELEPLRIRGLILHHSFFGGVDRTGSERKLANDRLLSLAVTDLMWELALPEGADRDHEYSNVTKAGGDPLIDRVGELEWRVFVTGCEGDPLFDRQAEVARFLEGKGVAVVTRFIDGGYHAVEIFEPEMAKPLFEALNDFIIKSCTSG